MPLVGVLGLTAPIWIGLCALLLFCAGLIARFTFELITEIKRLKTGVKAANARMQGALGEVKELRERAMTVRAGITSRRRRR